MTSPMPPGWHKTLDDLLQEMDEGRRLGISGEEADCARAYERSLLPPDTVFPRAGQVWESVGDCEVHYHATFAAPGSSGGTARLAGGERVRILQLPVGEPIVVYFVPLRYDDLHGVLIPPDVRSAPRYTNYCLFTKTAHFNVRFRLVEDVG